MLNQTRARPACTVEMLGELHPLMAQLGSSDGLVTLGSVVQTLELPRVTCGDSLKAFLQAYCRELLFPIELPAIGQAFGHACRNEVRELIELDQRLAQLPLLREFAAASQRVGRGFLERLRPLRDERVVQRYLRAVLEDRAHGWNTLVFGLTLALYSLPLRQGLLTYARQTLHGFIQVAARPLNLAKDDAHRLLEEQCANLAKELESIVALPALAV